MPETKEKAEEKTELMTRTYKVDRETAHLVDAACLKLSKPGAPVTHSQFVRDAIQTHLTQIKANEKRSRTLRKRAKSNRK